MIDTILFNGRITTLDPAHPSATAVAIKDGVFAAVGSDQEIMSRREPKTTAVDLQGRSVIPGLIDSHTHVIRGGLNYNMELRWDGVVSLADGLRMLREQAQRIPAPQWVRVIGGWSEFQFAERRIRSMPRRPRRPSSSCICTPARCSTRRRCARSATPGIQRIRPVA